MEPRFRLQNMASNRPDASKKKKVVEVEVKNMFIQYLFTKCMYFKSILYYDAFQERIALAKGSAKHC